MPTAATYSFKKHRTEKKGEKSWYQHVLLGLPGRTRPPRKCEGKDLPAQSVRSTDVDSDSQTQQWSEFAGGGTWSYDSKSVYSHRKNGNQSGAVVRISVPDGKIERVLDLNDITLGGYWPGGVSLLPDDSLLLMRNKNAQEIYRLDLQYR